MKVGWIVIGWLVVALSAVAALEAANALRWIEPDTGEGSGLYWVVTWPISPLLTMLVGGALLMAASLGARLSAALTVPILPLVAPAAGAVVALNLVTFDSYYLPSYQRVMEVMRISPAWFAVIAVSAVSVALVSWWRPRLGLFVTGASLWIGLVGLFLSGPWH
jgi:hypothetical protein